MAVVQGFRAGETESGVCATGPGNGEPGIGEPGIGVAGIGVAGIGVPSIGEPGNGVAGIGTVLGLHASFHPHPILGRHLRQASPPFGQWTPLFPRHPSLRYQQRSSHEDLSAKASVNLESFAHQPLQFPKPIRFQHDSDSEQFSGKFSPHALQFSRASDKQQLPVVHQLSKNPVNFFRGTILNDDSGSAFPDVINPFLNKHVSVLRYPSDFVRVDSSSESTQLGRDIKKIASRPYATRSPEVSFQELPDERLMKESDVIKYANNPSVSEFGRGLDSNENIRWSAQHGGQSETEKRIAVQVDSKGIKFTSVLDNDHPVQTHSPPTGGVPSSAVSDHNVGEDEKANDAKEHLEVIEDVNASTHQTKGQTTIVRLKGISLELPTFGSRKTHSSFRLPLPLHPIFQSNSDANVRLIPANQSVVNYFSETDSVLQSSESQRSVRKIVSASGSKGTKYDKCSHAFHAWMCPQVLVTPQRQNLPNSTTVKSLIQSANFHAPKNVQSFPPPVEISTTTESPRKISGTIQFEMPITRITNIPGVTARPTIRTTTQRRSGSTLFGEPIYTSPPPNIPHSTTSSAAAVPPRTTTEKNKSGSSLFDTLVTIPPLPSSKQYNKCSHTFHAWLCAKNPPTTSTAKPRSNNERPFSDSSFNVDVGSVPDPIPIPKPPESAPKTYSKCSHAFHSWLCPKQLLPVINRSTIPPPSTTPPKSGSGNFPETTSPRSGSINVPEIVLPEPPITTTLPPITTRRGSANFPVPQILLAAPIQPSFSTTQKVQTTTPIPQHKPYDKCSHAFHSWLCQKPIRTRLSSIAVPSRSILNSPIALPKTTTEKSTTSTAITTSMKPKTGSIPFAEPVNQGKSLFPVLVPDKPSTTTSQPKTEIDICSHPLHAWICLPSTTTRKPRGKSAGELDSEPDKIKKGSQLFPDPQPTTSRPRERTTKAAWDGADPCTHAFHSWLCKPSHRRLTIPSIVKTARTKVAEASFPQNSVFLFSDTLTSPPQPTTTPSTTTTPRKSNGFLDSDLQTTKSPEEPTTIKVERGGELDSRPLQLKKKTDPCDHPFHSYLCTQSTTLAPPVQRKPTDGRGRSFDASTSNTRLKPPKTGRTDFGDPSPPKSTPSSTPKYDKCSHPFHSWLCDVARNIGQESKINSAAIDAYIESDRFLLKTGNLPNIRKLPLDTEETSQAFFPANFINMNQVSAGQIHTSNFPDNIQSTNFKVIHSGESNRSYQQIRATTPSQFEIHFGKKIIPTLPTINSPRAKKVYNEESVTLPTVSYNKDKVGQIFNLNNISTRVATVPPSRFFNSPKMISFDINDVPTVPPRPAREIDSTAFQNLFTNAHPDDSIKTFESNGNLSSSSLRILQNNLSRSLSNSFEVRQNASELAAFIPKILVSNTESGQQLHPSSLFLQFPSITNTASGQQLHPSSPFLKFPSITNTASGQQLHPSSPFLQFPSVTNTASLETVGQKNVPASIIHSHFPDNIPSSTLDLGDNEPQGIFSNAHSIRGDGNPSTNASKNENSGIDDSPRSNYSAGLEGIEKSESVLDFMTSIDKENGGNSQINANNFFAVQIADQADKTGILTSQEANVRQKQSTGVGKKQSLPINQHQKSLHSGRAQDDHKQENQHQLVNNQHVQLFKEDELEPQLPIQNHENAPQLLQTPKPNKEYLQLPIFHQFPLRQHEPQNFQNRGIGRHHYRSISLTPNQGEITPPPRNHVSNYQISGIWGIMESPAHSTPVTQALTFESQRIRNSPRLILDQSSGATNGDGHRIGGLHQAVSNSETPFAHGTYPSSFLVPPPISNSNLQFQRRSDNGLHHQINRRQFSIIPKATNSRHDALSPENDPNNLRYLELVLEARKNKRGEQAEIDRRQWLYLKAVNPVLNYLEPLASNQAAITKVPLGVFKTSRYK